MVAREGQILKLLGGNDKSFFIPVYQREYSWFRDNCERLIQVSYEINHDNVLYKELVKRIPDDAMNYFKAYMFEVEKNLPKFLIRDDMEENFKIKNKSSEGIDEVQDELETILLELPLEERLEMLDFFITMQPFNQLKDKYEEIKKKVLQ